MEDARTLQIRLNELKYEMRCLCLDWKAHADRLPNTSRSRSFYLFFASELIKLLREFNEREDSIKYIEIKD